MLYPALALRENLQFALWTIDQLRIGALRPVQRDLRILLAMRYQEGYLDAIQHPVEMHLLGGLHEFRSVLTTPNPTHMFPVVRNGKAPLAPQPLLLHIAPIMIGPPADTQREAWLE